MIFFILMKIRFILLIHLFSLFKCYLSYNHEYDFCNINESKTAYYIIQNIIDHYNIDSKDSFECMISNKNFMNYVEKFIKLEFINKNAYNQVKCPMCDKKFKNKNYLNMHYKIFHQSNSNMNNSNETQPLSYCPADFCRYINCDRYKRYLGLSVDTSKDNSYSNRQPKESIQECNKELIHFYRHNCMKILENCLGNIAEEPAAEKYFEFYTNICMKIKCNRDDPGYNSFKEELSPEGDLFDALRLITIYIVSICIIIYLLIIWVSKYS